MTAIVSGDRGVWPETHSDDDKTIRRRFSAKCSDDEDAVDEVVGVISLSTEGLRES